MEQFGISAYASDYSSLSLAKLVQNLHSFGEQKDQIREHKSAPAGGAKKRRSKYDVYFKNIKKKP